MLHPHGESSIRLVVSWIGISPRDPIRQLSYLKWKTRHRPEEGDVECTTVHVARGAWPLTASAARDGDPKPTQLRRATSTGMDPLYPNQGTK